MALQPKMKAKPKKDDGNDEVGADHVIPNSTEDLVRFRQKMKQMAEEYGF